MEFNQYKEVINEASEMFKALAHPTRFCIVCKLMLGELNVTQMQECLELTQSNISQHLSILKMKGIIKGERNGNEIVYSLIDDDIKKIIGVYFKKEEIPD